MFYDKREPNVKLMLVHSNGSWKSHHGSSGNSRSRDNRIVLPVGSQWSLPTWSEV